jgi:hypothetical protein
MKPRALLRPGHGLLLAIGLLSCRPVLALEVQHMQVQFRDGAYQLTMTALLAASLPDVESVLRDYARYPQLDTRILSSQVLHRSSATELELQTRINVCLSFLCRKVERVERVEERPGELLATVIPERSDAERGSTHTQLTAQGQQTRVTYVTDIEPKFWVPALLGRTMMLHSLRDATLALFESIEQRAAHPVVSAATTSAGS